ncbi:MAG: biotin--[acetyl-CoA-carboxylase] ligase [Bacteroidetes bacterium GWF2_38_335]|nr:MAG: biotin--[acetyl-CoA-carboxylase] ligase [Bacteroidetes bacterium GWF2_38_335]OFY78158.1 MAG: biotin--[acetyl-CoA-carboxylase] ligase [Bacteroidetes bacterium RIFOXYA12_FULL_38_20]HBS88682.1 biotin--[acetyl-CoA-carboxylase] ligase [Bacteroidales bacterium]
MNFRQIKIYRPEQTNSTNSFASNLINEGKEKTEFVVITKRQDKGKGQNTNKWESEPDKNLTFSLAIFPEQFPPQKQFLISKAVSLSILEVLINEIMGVSIKWPNDIYIGDKKVAGILIENTIKGSVLSHSIIGIGLNVNQEIFISDAPNPVSLRMLTGKNYDTEVLFKLIMEKIEKRFTEIFNGSFINTDIEYEKSMYLIGKESRFLENGIEFSGVIEGVNDYGQLKINTGKLIRVFNFNEIKFII